MELRLNLAALVEKGSGIIKEIQAANYFESAADKIEERWIFSAKERYEKYNCTGQSTYVLIKPIKLSLWERLTGKLNREYLDIEEIK